MFNQFMRQTVILTVTMCLKSKNITQAGLFSPYYNYESIMMVVILIFSNNNKE